MRIILSILLLLATTANAQRYVKSAANIAELIAMVPQDVSTNVYVSGYYTPNDGGGGTFYWNSGSSASTNLGTVFKSTRSSTGRWNRLVFGDISVKFFGAKGNGTNNDYLSIVDTIKYATNQITPSDYSWFVKSPPNVPVVYIPSGEYLITNTIRVPGYISMQGENRFASKLKAASTNFTLIYIGDQSGDSNFAFTNRNQKISKFVTVKNLTLQGTNVKTYPHSSISITNHALRIDGLFHGWFENLNINDFGGNGIEINKGEWVHFSDINIWYCRIGINDDASGASVDTLVTDNVNHTFDRVGTWANHQGFRQALASVVYAKNCYFESNIGSYYNATSGGGINDPKLQPDAFYLPSVNVNLTNTSFSVFTECYLEAAYIDIGLTNSHSIYFTKCFFNPTDGNSITNDNAVEWCSQYDILHRGNYISATGTNNPPNQAFILFSDNSGNNMVFDECWFYNSATLVDSTTKTQRKRVVFKVDNYSYPTFRNCLGLAYDNNTSVFSGTSPRIALEVHPNFFNSDAHLQGLTNVTLIGRHELTAKPSWANQISPGFANKQFAYDSNYRAANVYDLGYVMQGSGDQSTVYIPLDTQIGRASTPPTAGSWTSGSIVLNSSPTNGMWAGWINQSGTWKPFGNVGYSETVYYNAAGNYTNAPNENLILDDTAVALSVITNTMPSASLFKGRSVIVKDYGNNASVNNIMVKGQGSDKIDKAPYQLINTSNGSMRLISDGTDWQTY